MNLSRFLSIAALMLLAMLLTAPIVQGQGCSGCGGCNSGCCDLIPSLGLSLPSGEQDDVWSPGYIIGVEAFMPYNRNFSLGGRINFQRWRVNAAELLSLNDDDPMTVEDEEGWRALGSAAFLVKYDLPWPSCDSFRPWVEGGLSGNYVRTSGLYAKGFYAVGSMAVNREIRHDPKAEFAAGLSVGAGIKIANRIQPTVRYEQIFNSDTDGFGILTVSLGIVAQ